METKTNYLGQLGKELEDVQESGEFIDPVDENPGKNDIVLGDVPPEVKAILTIVARRNQELDEIEKAGVDRTALVRLRQIGQEAKVFPHLVWMNLETLYPGKTLKLVKGFKVVEPGKSDVEKAFENVSESLCGLFLVLSKDE
jgi:hypothetical protein